MSEAVTTKPPPGGGRRGMIPMVIATALFAAWLASGFYTVRGSDGEIGVATAFGQIVNAHVPAGVHWNVPRPLGRATKVKTAEPLSISVGFRYADDLRGLSPTPAETQWLTGNTNIVEVRAVMQYVVEDPAAYLYSGGDPPATGVLVRRAAEAGFTEVLGTLDVDQVLTSGQHQVLERVKERTNERLRAYGTGVRVIAASFKSIDPASPARSAFREVQDAESERGRLINDAKGYANDLLPKARGESQTVLAQARGDADSRVQAARGETDRFLSVLVEYKRAPERTRQRLYLETLEEILPRVRVLVSDGDAKGKGVDLHLLQSPP